jgi:SAM-dependent methyltransferase
MEVGTGHLPIAPVAFYLAGAREVVTVDLHRRLVPDLTRLMLKRLASSEAEVAALYDGLIDPTALRDRLAVVRSMADRPFDLFKRVGIRYIAPRDAAHMPDADASFGLHFSITVLEHVDSSVLSAVLTEARRLLRSDGFAAHFIDPSDHFSHNDTGISAINFLQFSEREWTRIAGNEFGYSNRLRASQLEAIFRACHFNIQHCDRKVDERSMRQLKRDFPLDGAFRRFEAADLCTTTLSVYARPAARG